MRHCTHAVRRLIATALATVALTLSLLLSGDAHAAVRQPAGIPDLAGMTLQLEDLPAGTTVDSQGYVRFPGTVAAYDRTFILPSGSGVEWIDGTTYLESSVTDASDGFNGFLRLLRSKAGRRTFAKGFADGWGAGKARVRVGHPHRFSAGDGAFTIRLRIKAPGVHINAVYANVHVDRAIGSVFAVGRRPAATLRETRRLLTAHALRMRVGLSPRSATPPSIDGAPAVGSTLEVAPGTWAAETKPTGFSYEWRRCDAAGAACVAIPGATGPSYVLTATDAGATFRIAVTATNTAGSTEAVSAPTQLVA